MSLLTKLSLLFGVTTLATFASTISFVGPDFPRPGANQGLPCNPATDIGCVLGDPGIYEVFGAQLTQPTMSNPKWVLTIETNFGDPTQNLIPGSPNVVPTFLYEVGGTQFTMGDFLITANGIIYGVVMHPHDGYLAGNLYTASGFQTSMDIMGGLASSIPNPRHNVWLAPGGTLVGSGTLTGAQTGNAVTTAKYTLTDQFSAPANFLPNGTTFNIDFSSYACANSVVMGSGSFTGGSGGGGGVPEPATLFLCVPVLLLFGFRLARQRGMKTQ